MPRRRPPAPCRAGGGLKTLEGKELLARLEAEGLVELPPLQATKPRGSHTTAPRTARGEAQEPLGGTVGDVAPVVLRRVSSESDRLLWRELVGRYHYLGHKVPFGAHLRYLVEVSRPSARVAGCLQASSPAWKMAPRDGWIGWSDAVRQRNLQLVVSNSRFLLLPWVEVSNLASSVLALFSRQLLVDWEGAYRVRPLLLETLVDEQRFTGTCYRAANWVQVGVTQGRGRMTPPPSPPCTPRSSSWGATAIPSRGPSGPPPLPWDAASTSTRPHRRCATA